MPHSVCTKCMNPYRNAKTNKKNNKNIQIILNLFRREKVCGGGRLGVQSIENESDHRS